MIFGALSESVDWDVGRGRSTPESESKIGRSTGKRGWGRVRVGVKWSESRPVDPLEVPNVFSSVVEQGPFPTLSDTGVFGSVHHSYGPEPRWVQPSVKNRVPTASHGSHTDRRWNLEGPTLPNLPRLGVSGPPELKKKKGLPGPGPGRYPPPVTTGRSNL